MGRDFHEIFMKFSLTTQVGSFALPASTVLLLPLLHYPTYVLPNLTYIQLYVSHWSTCIPIQVPTAWPGYIVCCI
jgi:hypothetical protein